WLAKWNWNERHAGRFPAARQEEGLRGQAPIPRARPAMGCASRQRTVCGQSVAAQPWRKTPGPSAAPAAAVVMPAIVPVFAVITITAIVVPVVVIPVRIRAIIPPVPVIIAI